MSDNSRDHRSRADAPDDLSHGEAERSRVVLFSFNASTRSEADEQGPIYAVRPGADLIVKAHKGWLESAVKVTPVEFYEHVSLLSKELSGGPDTGIDLMYVRHHGISVQPAPPRLAERVLYLALSKKARENLIGDLAEEYAGLRVRHGVRFANLWYRKQVCGSLLSLVPRAIRWGLLASAVEWVRRQL